MPQAFLAYFLAKRRDDRARKTGGETRNTGGEEATTRGRSSVRKIRSMDIWWVKRRIVEAMKSIASPRLWKRDAPSGGGTFLARISRLVARDSASSASSEEEQCSNEVEKLCKNGGDKTRVGRVKGEKESVQKRREKRAVGEEEVNVWRRVCSLLVGNRGAHSSPARRKSSNNSESARGPGWRRSVQVERLCTGSKVIVKSCRRSDRCQTEPLVIPDTPDTPCEVSEMRCQTSDLTVLLSDS